MQQWFVLGWPILIGLEWEFIKAVLQNNTRGKKRVDDRRVLNGIFFVLRTGIP